MNQEELIYRQLLRSYEEVRLANERELRRRKNEVYDAIPAYEELDNQNASDCITAATSLLKSENGCSVKQSVAEAIAKRREQKKQLLMNAGFPADYLEPIYTCPLCKDTGFIGSERCSCFRRAYSLALSGSTTLEAQLARENFSTFSFDYYDDICTDPALNLTPRANMRNVVSQVRDFLDNFDSDFRNLLIYGSTGVGKTFLSNCIAKSLIDSGHPVVYTTAHHFFELFSAHQNNRNDASSSTLWDYIFQCDCLIIDDLGTELTNTFTNSCLYDCLNERLLSRKPVVISTNLSLDRLRECYSERIFSRITGNYVLLKLFGKDIRLQKRIGNNP